jgi:trehalose 6-phosphate synthase/phosphatase
LLILFIVAGFHTFDYARHFLSCASRMLGLEHETLRGAISIEYYGRNVGIKIMPTGEGGDKGAKGDLSLPFLYSWLAALWPQRGHQNHAHR